MKKLLLTLTILCAALTTVFAQSATTSFDVDGIKVIFKPTVKEIINVRVYFKGGVTNYPASQAGIESFTLSAISQCGTKKYDANAFRNLADNYSIEIGADATYDYGVVEMECVSQYLNYGWDLFANAIVNPVFDPNEVELLRNKILAGERQASTDPDKRSDQLILQNAFAGTPYATDPNGTEETLSKFTADDLRAYYKSILNKNQMFIVVAGKISKEELVAKIHASFANLPSRPYQAPHLHAPLWNDYKVLIEKRDLSTNYINAIMNSPPVYSPDYVPYRLAISVLAGSLFSDLRTDLNLGYDPGAESVMRKMPYATMSISTTQPTQAVHEMVKILNLVRQYGVSERGLKQLKSSYITTSYITQQSTSAITGALGEAEIFGGWETAEQLPALIDRVTIQQIDNAINEYVVGLRWSYLGNADQAADAKGAFSEQVK
jgi:zinc protease